MATAAWIKSPLIERIDVVVNLGRIRNRKNHENTVLMSCFIFSLLALDFLSTEPLVWDFQSKVITFTACSAKVIAMHTE